MRSLPITIIIITAIMLTATVNASGTNQSTSATQRIESMYDTDDDMEESESAGPEVPVAHDLLTLAAESRQREVPILLMFSAEDCDYCERLEEDIVRPMLISGEFDRRAIFRKIMIDGTDKLKDFHGSDRDPEEYAWKQKIQVTPTLVFVDSKGNELAPKVVGYQMGGLFMAYLNRAIDTSQQTLRQSLSQTFNNTH